jgi:class 3 adenylate cyclase
MMYSTRFQIYAYYFLSVVVLAIFAFRSSSDYLGHPKYYIILLISLPYLVSGVVRSCIEPVMLRRVSPLNQSRRQLCLDLGLFSLVAFSLVCIEFLMYGHTANTALKTGIWALMIGYFASIDSTLHRVRSSQSSQNEVAEFNEKALPVSQKLSIFLSSTVLLIIIATATSAYGYLSIDTSLPLHEIKQEFIVETLFILGIVGTLTTRVIVSYSINLQFMFETQISTLRNVQEGELGKHVPVLTQDEFGIIAQQTNLIIDQLREKERIQKTLEQVVSPNIMEKLLSGGGKETNKAQELELAILFCDLRQFTSYAESKPPDEVIVFLNAYFTKLADVIAEQNGIVNKFIGDAILAVFGVDGNPHYAEHAVEAAFDILMHSSSAVMRDGTKFDVGIGINCGRAAAGTIGSSERFEYTFIGDSVNVASRLDGLSKRLQYKIVISAEAYNRLSEDHRELFADLGEHNIRGKSQAVHLYGAIPEGEIRDDSKIVQLSTLYRSAER